MSFSTLEASQRIWIWTVKLPVARAANSRAMASTRSRPASLLAGTTGVRAVTRGSACVGGGSTEAVAGATVVVVDGGGTIVRPPVGGVAGGVVSVSVAA